MPDRETYEVYELLFNNINTKSQFDHIDSLQYLFDLPQPLHIQQEQVLSLLYAISQEALDNVDDAPLVIQPHYDEVYESVLDFVDAVRSEVLEVKIESVTELHENDESQIIEVLVHASGAKLSGKLLGYFKYVHNYHFFLGALVHETEATLYRPVFQKIVQTMVLAPS